MLNKVGCRAHDYGKDTIDILTHWMAEDGYRTTQLALKKAVSGVSDLPEVLSGSYAKAIKSSMAKQNVEISVLGAYLNYAHPDESVRNGNIDLLKGHIKVAKDMGARMVGTETGSLDKEYKAHAFNHGEKAYERFRDAIAQVMPLTETCDTWMAVEAVAHHIINTPERMNRLIRDIDHPRLKVIFDINNLLTPENYEQQDALIHQMFELLGDKIVAVHVKDFDIVNGEKVIVPLGKGKLNLELLMDKVMESSEQVDALAENIPKEHLAEASRILNHYMA